MLSLSALLLAITPAAAAVFPENLLGLDEATITGILETRGYSVQAETKDFNYLATYKDRSKAFLDGGFTLCKGKTIFAVIGIDADTEYNDQLKLLIKEYGQPAVSVQKIELVDGDTSSVDLEWESTSRLISLRNYPPSKFWKVPTTAQTALLLFSDLNQNCYFAPPRVKAVD